MKKSLPKLYSALFIGMCLVPSVTMPFTKENSKEKRQLSEVPKVKTEEGINFSYLSDLGAYFSDHFGLRQQLVTADGEIKTRIFGTSPNSDVISGKDGWLYYAYTADDFLNINTISRRAVNNIVHNLGMLQNYCEQRNAVFIFTVAPNKNSVYPEFMPINYVRNGNNGNYENLISSLPSDFPYCDMKSAIIRADSSIPLYHKEDTHWNNLGAYVGHVALMDMLGKDICPAEEWYTKNDRQGDLSAMIYPSAKADDTQVYNDYQFKYQYTSVFRGLDDVEISTVCDGKINSLLMYRDSYGEAVLPYLAECFGTAQFSRAVPYKTESIGNGGADTVILEIVERNIPNLQKYAPVMPAPAVPAPDLSTAVVCGDYTLESVQYGNYLHIFGELGEEFFSGDSTSIYVSVDGISYEAFNAFEDKLLNREGEFSDRGFSMYIPYTEGITNENISVTAVNADGTVIYTGF